MNAIEILGITKEYGGRRVVDKLELTVRAGELFALLGINGAGKSTTIKMLSCLTVPTAGDANLMGHSIRSDSRAAKELLAVSPQETAIAPNLTVWENLELMAGVYRRPREAAEELAQGKAIGELTEGMKYYSYYLEAYTAVLGGMVGEYEIQVPAETAAGQAQGEKEAEEATVRRSNNLFDRQTYTCSTDRGASV